MNIAVFVSGGGTNLQAIIDSINSGTLQNINISVVIASRDGIYALERARKNDIPFIVISNKSYDNENDFDNALTDALEGREIDLVVLAGYLSKLGPGFIRKYTNRIINIHPSLIPSFCGDGMFGIKPHKEAIRRGVKITGATVHFVEHDYDNGPIIIQKAVCVKDEDTPETLQIRVMEEAERLILPEAIGYFRDNRIRITADGRRTVILS